MSVTETARRLAESTFDVVPIDLVAVLAYVGFASAAVAIDVGGTVFGFVVGSVLVFFVPGYAVIAALFPRRPQNRDAGEGAIGLSLTAAHDGVLARERLALSFGVSLTLVPIAAVTLGALGIRLTTESVLATVWVVVVLGVLLGTARRLSVPAHERFDPLAVAQQTGSERFLGGDVVTKALTVCLCIAVVAALGSLTVALAGPTQSMSYTSASLLTESPSGETIAGGYPTNGTVGESESLVVEVTNHHDSAATYTVVARLQRVDGGTILASETLGRQSQRVEVNETWTYDHTVTPTMAGQDLRLAYYIVRGPMPETLDDGTADKVLYLRLDVAPR